MRRITVAQGHQYWEHVDCFLCGRKAETSLIYQDEYQGDIVCCSHCSLVFRNPRLREEAQNQYFEEKWTEARTPFYLLDFRQPIMKCVVDYILKTHPSPGTVLDVGCSYGTLLAQFPHPWDCWGLDPSLLACSEAQKRLPTAHIIKGTLGTTNLPHKMFDVITLVDAIYYFPNPIRDIAIIGDLLKENGLLFVETLNFNNRKIVYRFLRRSFPSCWMFFLTPLTLEKILQKAGFKVTDKFYLPGNLVGSRKYFERFMSKTEYFLTKALYNLSHGSVDIIPHFVLVAKKAQNHI